MIVMKYKGLDIAATNADYMEIGMEDFEDICDYLMWYGSRSNTEYAENRKKEITDMFPGVKFFSV